MKKIQLLIVIAIICPVLVYAKEVKNRFQWLNALYFSGGLETKIVFSYEEKYPFLQGKDLLTKNNTLLWKGLLELSPVSLNLGGEVAISPLAVLVFSAGGKVGTGWTTLSFVGLALNPPSNMNATQTPTPFGGAVIESWIKGAFQFDTGVVFPGDWNHIILYTEHTLDYRMLTSADDNTPWLFEADSGQNYNGWRYLTTSLIAYQMPLWVRHVGFLVSTKVPVFYSQEAPAFLYETEWVFGPLVSLQFGRHSASVLLQWYTQQQFSMREGHFTTWKYESTQVKPYRVAFTWSYEW